MEKSFRFKKADIGVFNAGSDQVANRIEPGCRIMGFTRGEFSLIDLIYSILKKTGQANVVCVTWSAGIKDAHQVRWMLDTNLIDTFTVITDHSYATRQKKYAMALTDLFGKENIRTSEIHAKFTLIWNDDWSICIRHSMNLNANRTCESFEIDDDKDVFDFYMKFVDHTLSDLEGGFEPRSWKVNDSLDKFFEENQELIEYSFFTNE